MLGLPLDMQTEVQGATGVKRYEPEPIGRAHKAWLKRAIPGLSEANQALANDMFGFNDLDDEWRKNLHDVAIYWDEHGKLPRTKSNDDSERRLGSWVGKQRQNKRLAPERRAAIMEQCPAILVENLEGVWERTLAEVAAHWEQFRKLPSQHSADESERRPGLWVSVQRKSKSITPERRAAIMEQCPAILAGR
jgi:hypothetical protein